MALNASFGMEDIHVNETAILDQSDIPNCYSPRKLSRKLVLMLVLATVGALGNGVGLFVMARRLISKSPVFVFFFVISLADLLSLSALMWEILDVSLVTLPDNTAYCKLRRFVPHFAHFLSACLVAVLSVEWFLCVRSSTQINVKRRIHIECAIAILASLLLNSHFLIRTDLKVATHLYKRFPSPNATKMVELSCNFYICQYPQDMYLLVWNHFAWIAFFWIPFGIILVFAILLIWLLRQRESMAFFGQISHRHQHSDSDVPLQNSRPSHCHHKSRSNLTTNRQRSFMDQIRQQNRRLTMNMVAICFFFLIFNFSYIFALGPLGTELMEKLEFSRATISRVRHGAIYMKLVNHAFNCCLYLFGSSFRSAFMEIVCGRRSNTSRAVSRAATNSTAVPLTPF